MCSRYGVYVLIKQLFLPLKEIDQSLPQRGKIIDLGCGEGFVAKYLARRQQRSVVGVDLSKSRLPKTDLKNLRFECLDIITFNISGAKGIILSDVLHHLDLSKQKKLLFKISKNLTKGSVLVIKEIDTQEFIRSKLSRFWDFIFYPQDKIYYSGSQHFKLFLENLGFHVKLIRTSRLFPGSTTLYIARK